MVNSVTCKFVLRREQKNKMDQSSLVVQCFVNHQRVVIPLSIYIEERYFDAKRELVKNSHPQANHYNRLLADARSRVVIVQTEANIQNIQLNKDNFRAKFTLTQTDLDFIGFYRKQLDKRIGSIERSSLGSHRKTLNKLVAFRGALPFSMLNVAFLEAFETYLKVDLKNATNTIYSDLKNIRTYTNRAISEGIEIKNPFKQYKLTQGGTRVIFCTIEEQTRLLKAYDNYTVPEKLRSSLLVFLVSCFTSLRISDIKRMTRGWVTDDVLSFLPRKSKRYNRYVNVPLSQISKRILHDFFEMRDRGEMKSDQRINDDLKLIAAYQNIHKSLSLHIGRHTFATTFLELGGSVEVLKEILGHAKIQDTMIYVHVNDKRKANQMQNFNNQFV